MKTKTKKVKKVKDINLEREYPPVIVVKGFRNYR